MLHGKRQIRAKLQFASPNRSVMYGSNVRDSLYKYVCFIIPVGCIYVHISTFLLPVGYYAARLRKLLLVVIIITFAALRAGGNFANLRHKVIKISLFLYRLICI